MSKREAGFFKMHPYCHCEPEVLGRRGNLCLNEIASSKIPHNDSRRRFVVVAGTGQMGQSML